MRGRVFMPAIFASTILLVATNGQAASVAIALGAGYTVDVTLSVDGSVYDAFSLQSSQVFHNIDADFQYFQISNDKLGNSGAYFGTFQTSQNFGSGQFISPGGNTAYVYATYDASGARPYFYSYDGTTAMFVTGTYEVGDPTHSPSETPEPKTWVEMLIGISMLGAALRRIKNTRSASSC